MNTQVYVLSTDRWSFPVHMADPVPLVEEWVVHSWEQWVLKQCSTLLTLPLEGGVMLPLIGLHRGEHPSACSCGTETQQKEMDWESWQRRHCSTDTVQGPLARVNSGDVLTTFWYRNAFAWMIFQCQTVEHSFICGMQKPHSIWLVQRSIRFIFYNPVKYQYLRKV